MKIARILFAAVLALTTGAAVLAAQPTRSLHASDPTPKTPILSPDGTSGPGGPPPVCSPTDPTCSV